MRVAALVLLVGCSFREGHLGVGDALGDAQDDARDGGNPSACAGWQARHFDACTIPMPGTDVHLTSPASPLTYDTTNGGGELRDNTDTVIAITSVDYTQPGGVHAALWTMENFTIDPGVVLRVIGGKPLIIAAWGAIAVGGTIDAGSYWNGQVGAGSNPAACASHAAGNGTDGASGNGGGGGGGFGGNGAAGGRGDSNCTPSPPTCERPGGVAGGAVAAPVIVIGGCNGGASGLAGSTFAAGGRGGGAVLLAARGALAISGSLLAGGAGGAGDATSTFSTGGGGGGAGGLLGLEASSIDVTGTIAANGGAGGAGADIANVGGHGGDGAAASTSASGGVSATGGTNGGAGSSISVLDGGAVPGPTQVGGGGGGGGGAGFVLYWTTSFAPGGTISPTALAGP